MESRKCCQMMLSVNDELKVIAIHMNESYRYHISDCLKRSIPKHVSFPSFVYLSILIRRNYSGHAAAITINTTTTTTINYYCLHHAIMINLLKLDDIFLVTDLISLYHQWFFILFPVLLWPLTFNITPSFSSKQSW